MRILISSDVPKYFVAGSNTFVTQLSHLLHKRGHTVAMLCASRSLRYEAYMDRGTLVLGVSSFRSIEHHTLRIAFPVGVKTQIVKAFDAFKPDLLHVQSHGPLPASAIKVAKRFGIPTMGTNHFVPDNIIDLLHVPKLFRSLLGTAMWKHLHFIFAKLNCITTPTVTAANILHASGFLAPIKVISNGIDLSRFNVDNRSGSLQKSLRHKYNLESKPTLLSVGRLDPEKNMKYLIQSIPQVLVQIDMQLIVVGTGTESRRLKKLVRKLRLEHNVIFTDYLPGEDLPAMFGFADCFIMPGTAELQGISLMEAMASGLPVIAADSLALPELLKDGENGFLFTPNECKSIATCIAVVLKDKEMQIRMGAKSLELIQTHDLLHTVDAFEALYQDVIDRNHQRGETSSRQEALKV